MDYIISIIPQMLAGCQVTAQVFFFTIILSIPLGLVLAFGRVSNLSLVKHFIAFYVWVMRGTPLMLQLLFFYFALPSIGIRFDDFTAAMIAFVLNYAAYFCEIFRPRAHHILCMQPGREPEEPMTLDSGSIIMLMAPRT